MKEIVLQLNHRFSDIELQHWPKLFDSPACKVTLAADGNYYLTACRFEKLTDPKEVFKSEKKLKTMMHAIFKIEKADFENLVPDETENVPSSYRERVGDTLNTYVGLVAPSAVASALPVTVKIIDKYHNGTPEARKKRWYDCYLDRCDDWIDNTVVFEALSDFAENTEARTLRLTYEVIEKDKGGELGLHKWVTPTELSDFTGSINHPDMDKPLHAYLSKKHRRKKRVKKAGKIQSYDLKMNLDKARIFLAQKLLKQWLIEKREIYKLAEGAAQANSLSTKLNF